jgi:hypothetical protein
VAGVQERRSLEIEDPGGPARSHGR